MDMHFGKAGREQIRNPRPKGESEMSKSSEIVDQLKKIALSKESLDFAHGRKAPLYGKETEVEWQASSHIEALEAENETLRLALKPFANVADIFDHASSNRPTKDGDTVYQWADHRVGERELMVVDFRTARQVLSKAKQTHHQE